MRRATVAGKFYSSDRTELIRQIEKNFSSLDIASLKSRPIKAAIVPHAGYAFSGKCASYVYKLIRDNQFDSFILLGTNHSNLGANFSLSIEDFETPLGVVETDLELVEEIITQSNEKKINLEVDESSHRYEHSLEVQLPFLQNVARNFKIVAMVIKETGLDEIERFSEIISSIVQKSSKKILVLASSDFTHYGRDYAFLPFKEEVKENLYALDAKIINSILKLDEKSFFELANSSTVCGKFPIACVINIARKLGLKPEKLCYYTSGDVFDEWDSVVGYASIAFSS